MPQNINYDLMTLIGLSDREKFHTGMLAYLFKKKELKKILLGSLFNIDDQSAEQWEVFVEEDSIDMGFKSKASLPLLIEVKLKSSTTIEQIKKYSTKLNNKRYKGEPGRFYLLGLLEPLIVVNKSSNYINTLVNLSENKSEVIIPQPISYGYLYDILNANLKDIYNELSTQEAGFYQLWIHYLEKLKRLSEIFKNAEEENKLNQISSKQKKEIESLRLIGGFERFRFEQLFMLLKQGNNLSNLCTYHFGNTHGRALFEINIGVTNDRVEKIGLQWQNDVVKLFICNKDKPKKKDEKRDEILIGWFEELKTNFENRINFEENSKINKENQLTKFRSVNLFKKPVFDELDNNFIENFIELINAVMELNYNR
jgi:hypothetical protein